MPAYYNEFDPFAAAWLRELIREGVIADGEVDERSILDVQPDDLRGFAQCHFFAGIGGWSYALRLAGWPDDRAVWTGSCPCQPFSAAGKGEGFNDSRHLWPAWFRLIRECRPATVFGEQVASADGRAWLDTVSTDLEDAGYAFGSANLCAAGAGAPHIRQRLYFTGKRLADAKRGATERQRCELAGEARGAEGSTQERERVRDDARDGGNIERLADSEPSGLRAADGGMDHAASTRHDDAREHGSGRPSFWRDIIWLQCSDGKLRPTQSGIFPLASRVSGRVGILRGAGNSIVPEIAAAFVEAADPLTADHLIRE